MNSSILLLSCTQKNIYTLFLLENWQESHLLYLVMIFYIGKPCATSKGLLPVEVCSYRRKRKPSELHTNVLLVCLKDHLHHSFYCYHFFDRMHIDAFIFKDVQNISSKSQGTILPKFFSYKSFHEVSLLTVVCKLFLSWLLYSRHVPHPAMSSSSLYIYKFRLLFMLRGPAEVPSALSPFPRTPKRGK